MEDKLSKNSNEIHTAKATIWIPKVRVDITSSITLPGILYHNSPGGGQIIA